MPTYLRNRKAYHDYNILEDYEAGIKLQGHEVKSIREGHGNLTGTYVRVDNGEFWLTGFNLPAYSKSGILLDYDPERSRKLLLTAKEINSLRGKIERQGYTLVPLKIYTKNNLLKLSVGLARGKKKSERKDKKIADQQKRDTDRAIKESLV